MSFWTWALEAYARPGAADACLRLQDEFDQCVPYLLWAVWAAGEGRALDAKALTAGAALSERWQSAAVAPLRQARRAMKPSVEGIEDAAREALRVQVKALELKAEQLLIETLQTMAPEPGGAVSPLAATLTAAVEAWPSKAAPEALERLAQILS
jgi:uncharacterized protein (TIGR02444 family)